MNPELTDQEILAQFMKDNGYKDPSEIRLETLRNMQQSYRQVSHGYLALNIVNMNASTDAADIGIRHISDETVDKLANYAGDAIEKLGIVNRVIRILTIARNKEKR